MSHGGTPLALYFNYLLFNHRHRRRNVVFSSRKEPPRTLADRETNPESPQGSQSLSLYAHTRVTLSSKPSCVLFPLPPLHGGSSRGGSFWNKPGAQPASATAPPGLGGWRVQAGQGAARRHLPTYLFSALVTCC